MRLLWLPSVEAIGNFAGGHPVPRRKSLDSGYQRQISNVRLLFMASSPDRVANAHRCQLGLPHYFPGYSICFLDPTSI